jgi:S-adenosylmethionine hydrolase
MPAAELLGGPVEAVDVGNSPERLEPVSRSFHGRDIFAPVAAALAAGERLADVGDAIGVRDLHGLDLSSARLADGVLKAHVLRWDVFGNVILDARADQLAALGIALGGLVTLTHAGRTHAVRYASTFADVPPGELFIYEDAQQTLALAVNLGSAAELLRAVRDEEILLCPG